jgi:mono/diheme cytochrome c family protein
MDRYRKTIIIVALANLTSFVNTTTRADQSQVNFSEHIATIIFDNCSSCHHQGQAGPFALMSFADVQRHAATIREVVNQRYMPPWKPKDTGIAFANHRQLSQEQIDIINRWVEEDCPEGDPSKCPPAPMFVDGWSLGPPDLVVKMEQSFQVPASGPDIYRSFVLPLNLPEDKWVKALELRPTARGAVHHALFFIADSNQVRSRKERDGQTGLKGMNFLRGSEFLEQAPDRLSRGLGGFVPGAVPAPLPGDLARFLPKGTDIIMQTHFHPSGKPETEQAELALYFTDKAPSRMIVPLQMPPMFGIGAGIDVPAGEANFTISDTLTLPIDVRGIEIGGHAHYICREMLMVAELPNGKKLELLRIDDWDLDWQDQYQFATPVELAKGTKISATIVYDNSANNPENPFSPPQRIAWGRESNDEMGSITLHVIAADETERPQLERLVQKRTRESMRQRVQGQNVGLSALGGGAVGRGGLLKIFDRNKDGKLQSQELPDRFRDRLLDFLDENSDDTLDEAEIAKGRKSMDRILDRKEDEEAPK